MTDTDNTPRFFAKRPDFYIPKTPQEARDMGDWRAYASLCAELGETPVDMHGYRMGGGVGFDAYDPDLRDDLPSVPNQDSSGVTKPKDYLERDDPADCIPGREWRMAISKGSYDHRAVRKSRRKSKR